MEYRQICDLYKSARESYFSLHDCAEKFCKSLRNELFNDLGLNWEEDQELLTVMPVDQDEVTDYQYTPNGAVKLDSSGMWTFSLLLRVHIDANKRIHPAEVIRLNIFLGIGETSLTYTLVRGGQEYTTTQEELLPHIKKVTLPEVYKIIEMFYKNRSGSITYEKDQKTPIMRGLSS